jgi:hypothetical protein
MLALLDPPPPLPLLLCRHAPAGQPQGRRPESAPPQRPGAHTTTERHVTFEEGLPDQATRRGRMRALTALRIGRLLGVERPGMGL